MIAWNSKVNRSIITSAFKKCFPYVWCIKNDVHKTTYKRTDTQTMREFFHCHSPWRSNLNPYSNFHYTYMRDFQPASTRKQRQWLQNVVSVIWSPGLLYLSSPGWSSHRHEYSAKLIWRNDNDSLDSWKIENPSFGLIEHLYFVIPDKVR